MYILDPAEQAELIGSLVLVETLEGGWSKKYRNPVTGAEWLKFFVGAGHGQIPVLREDPPPANMVERVEGSFSSGRQDDVVGLALELSEKPETWDEVIRYLETNGESIETGQIAIFIKRLNVLNPVNRRPILNKHSTEVEMDAQYFRDLSERAERLLNAA